MPIHKVLFSPLLIHNCQQIVSPCMTVSFSDKFNDGGRLLSSMLLSLEGWLISRFLIKYSESWCIYSAYKTARWFKMIQMGDSKWPLLNVCFFCTPVVGAFIGWYPWTNVLVHLLLELLLGDTHRLLYIYPNSCSAGIDFRRHILMAKVDLPLSRITIFIMAVDPFNISIQMNRKR